MAERRVQGMAGNGLSRARAASLMTIAADLLGGLRTEDGPAWLQRRWGADVEIAVQRDRRLDRWRVATTLTDRRAPDDETLALIGTAFGVPVGSEWRRIHHHRKRDDGRLVIWEVAEVTWVEG